MAQPAVSAQTPPNDLTFPANLCPLHAGWKLLFYWPDGHIVVVGDVDAETANRLADTLAAVLQSELGLIDFELEGSPDDESYDFDPF